MATAVATKEIIQIKSTMVITKYQWLKSYKKLN
jgi:hypothetical protein